MPRSTLRIGDYNVICDRCGFQYKASQLQKEWTGFMVCKECYEPRHPMDFMPAPKAEKAPPWIRPPNEVEISPDYVDSSVGVQE
jgi:hypothetical protein